MARTHDDRPRGFVQLQRYGIDVLTSHLTPHQLGVLVRLCLHIGRTDTVLRHDDGRGAPMTVSDIAILLRCTRQQANRTLRALEQSGAIQLSGSTSARTVEVAPWVAHRYGRAGDTGDGSATKY